MHKVIPAQLPRHVIALNWSAETCGPSVSGSWRDHLQVSVGCCLTLSMRAYYSICTHGMHVLLFSISLHSQLRLETHPTSAAMASNSAAAATPKAASSARSCPEQVRRARLLQQAQLLLARNDFVQAQAPGLALRVQLAALAPRAGLRRAICHIGVRRVALSPLLLPPVKLTAPFPPLPGK